MQGLVVATVDVCECGGPAFIYRPRHSHWAQEEEDHVAPASDDAILEEVVHNCC